MDINKVMTNEKFTMSDKHTVRPRTRHNTESCNHGSNLLGSLINLSVSVTILLFTVKSKFSLPYNRVLRVKGVLVSNKLSVTLDIFSSADPKVSSAELMVLLIVRCPSSSVRELLFKSLLLLQFLFDNSEFFTGETRHIVPPCNKAGISNFCLEFQKLQKFQIS